IKKRHVFLLISLIYYFVLANNSFAFNLSQLPGNKEFSKLKDKLIGTVKNIGTFKAAEAFDEIQKNLRSFQVLKTKLRNAQNVDSVIDEVAQSLKNMSRSYSKIAKLKYEVFAQFDIEEKNLGEIDGQILDTVDELKGKLLEIQHSDVELKRRLTEESNRTEKRKIEMTINANKSVSNSINAHLLIWDKFHETQKPLLKKLNQANKIRS
ncbi:conserved hypothetical protein, secreted, partial [Candidatus Magnetomorum sp. HK-1]